MRIAGLSLLLLAACAHRAAPEVLKLNPDHEEPDLVTVRHRVAPGETLYRIAKENGLSVEDLAAANGITDPASLAVGQELVIPGSDAPAPASSGDEEPAGHLHPPEARAPPDARHGMLTWPLRGVLYAKFGKKGKEPHDGIDLAAPAGSPIKTAGEGTVLFAGEQRGYGEIVIVEHAGGLMTLYAHNKDVRVKSGQRVHDGEVIATVGESGRTSGPHLHFEVRRNGVPVDPLAYLPDLTRGG